MTLRRFLFSVLALLLFSADALAQHPDSLVRKEDSISIYRLYDGSLMHPRYRLIDDQHIRSMHSYENLSRLELGIAGAPGYALIYNPELPLGFVVNNRPSLSAETNPGVYYHTTTPYTVGSFFLGSKEEQQFSILHTQNIRPNWNAGFRLDRLNAIGFYERQKVVDERLNVNTNFRSLDQRYQLFADFIGGNYTLEENGGISDESYFTDNLTDNRKVIPLFLSNAASQRKSSGFNVKQYLYFGKKIAVEDTLQDDYVEHNGWRLAVQNQMRTTRFRYVDDLTNSTFYDTTYLYQYATDDRSDWRRYRNDLKLEYIGKGYSEKPSYIHGSVGIGQGYDEYRQHGESRFNRQVIAMAEVLTGKAEAWDLHIDANFLVLGEQSGDYKLNARYARYFSSYLKALVVDGLAQSRTPGLFYRFNNSNHFQWENNFNNTDTQKGRLRLFFKDDLSLTGDYSTIQGVTYFDTLAMPRQNDSSAVNIQHAGLAKEFNWGKGKWKWLLRMEGHYQRFTGPNVIRLPELFTTNQLAAEFPMFKKRMQGRLGMEATWYSDFKGNAYMPATGVFYLQDSLSIGNYPFIDMFFNFRIRNVRAFVKMTHINSGMMGYQYWAAPRYAFRDRAIRFGLEWKFYN